MHWIITKDLVNTSPGDTSKVNYKRAAKSWLEAYRLMDTEQKALALAAFKSEMTHEFQLYSDDNELYYEGLCKDLDQQGDASAFQPLDWALADVGATYMMERKIGEEKWSQL